MSKNITRVRFLAISRVIKDQKTKGLYKAEDVAEAFKVSASTVRTIARMKTFPEFERRKAAIRERRNSQLRSAAVPKVTAPEQKTIAEELVELAGAPITHDELNDALRPLFKRLANIESHLRKPFWRRLQGGRNERN